MGTDPEALPTAAFLRALSGGDALPAGAALPPLLLDADALTLLGSGALTLPESARATRAARAAEALAAAEALQSPEATGLARPRILLTPHAGEMGRIYPEGRGQSAAAQAAGAAEAHGAICLFKGAPSIVSAPGTPEHWISASGGSPFAAGGMGDVLAGVAGAFMARGVRVREAAGLALHLTGRAADRVLASGVAGDALLPSDLVEALPHALDELATHPTPRTAGTSNPDVALPPCVLLDLAPPR
jgi:ADP-dependent NAD(P)H-hydrate dehydratase / NAD(P)H-hydrate epimerase